MPAKRRLKILVIPKWYPSEVHVKSGVFVEEMSKAVSALHDVTVLFAYPAPNRIKGNYEVLTEEHPGLKVIRVRYRNFLPLPGILETWLFNWWIKQLYKKLLAANYRPDIIHAHVYRAAPASLAIGKMSGAPVILSEHSLELLNHRELTPEFKFFAQRYLPRFSLVLPVSRVLAAGLKKLSPKIKIQILPNVVDTTLFFPTTTPAAKDQLKKILTVSLLMPVKGMPELLRAVKELSVERQDFTLEIVGDGLGRPTLEKFVTDNQLQDRIHFHGMKSKGEVAQMMRECTFFTLPSHMETFGCVFIEALACGKPVVTTQAGNMPDLINEERGLLVPPKDPVALKAALNKMLDQADSYPTEKISAYARENFSYQAVTAKLDRIYQEAKRC